MYTIEYTDLARRDLERLKRDEPKIMSKLRTLLIELMEHPQTGTGRPEQLKGNRAGQWSRRLSQKHRIIYTINNQQVVVLVLSAYGHYDDK